MTTVVPTPEGGEWLLTTHRRSITDGMARGGLLQAAVVAAGLGATAGWCSPRRSR